jgi:hypothetical protein
MAIQFNQEELPESNKFAKQLHPKISIEKFSKGRPTV